MLVLWLKEFRKFAGKIKMFPADPGMNRREFLRNPLLRICECEFRKSPRLLNITGGIYDENFNAVTLLPNTSAEKLNQWLFGRLINANICIEIYIKMDINISSISRYLN